MGRPPASDPSPVQHGTEYGYRSQRCRCEACRQAARDGRARKRDGLGCGSSLKYAYGCHCDECRGAHRERRLANLASSLASGAVSHGSASTYARGCRCRPCRSAYTDRVRQQRRAKLEDMAAQAHHPTKGLTRAGCRCEPCAALRRSESRSKARRDQQRAAADPRFGHGTPRKYQSGCRCPDCVDAKRRYKAECGRRRLESPDLRCGTTARYEAGCRCTDCAAAHRDYMARYKARRSQAGDFDHGTTTGWAIGCRCVACAGAARVGEYRRRFGVTSAEASALLEQTRAGHCGCCGDGPTAGDVLAVDHDHLSGRVRGVLCRYGNQALGHLGDLPEHARRLALYLDHHARRPTAGPVPPELVDATALSRTLAPVNWVRRHRDAKDLGRTRHGTGLSADLGCRCEPCARAARHRRLRKRFKIGIADQERLLGLQDERCAACRAAIGPDRLTIDHDHGSGRVRALLCFSCNSAAGLLRDEPRRALAAERYLRLHDRPGAD